MPITRRKANYEIDFACGRNAARTAARARSSATLRAIAVAMLASTLLVSSPAPAAKIKRSGTTIEITGPIMPGDAVPFTILIESTKNGGTVILNSPGGALDDSINIGHLVRDHGFTTKVPEATFCFSGCALIWLAGVKREIGFGGAIGFHSATKGRGRDDEGNIKTMVYLTAIDMSRDIIDMAVAADPRRITTPTAPVPSGWFRTPQPQPRSQPSLYQRRDHAPIHGRRLSRYLRRQNPQG
jgi:hypothetical protein